MSIFMNSDCFLCQLNRHLNHAKKLGDERQTARFAKALMKLYAEAPEDACAPYFSGRVNDLFQKFYGLDPDRYRQEKADSNQFVLERLPQLRSRVEAAADPIYTGLQLAIFGNYIDFGALQDAVSFEELDRLLEQAEEKELDRTCYQQLLQDLENGKNLVYLTDNAGEIGFDRVLAEQIHRRYPALQITFCVRGGPALNDATREDAALMEIPFPVIDNGTCIAGTLLDEIGEEARQALYGADLILAKGQGNCESLYQSGLNIYFAFLVKCDRFINAFHQPKFTPILTK